MELFAGFLDRLARQSSQNPFIGYQLVSEIISKYAFKCIKLLIVVSHSTSEIILPPTPLTLTHATVILKKEYLAQTTINKKFTKHRFNLHIVSHIQLLELGTNRPWMLEPHQLYLLSITGLKHLKHIFRLKFYLSHG
jgi:hypothetical protein